MKTFIRVIISIFFSGLLFTSVYAQPEKYDLFFIYQKNKQKHPPAISKTAWEYSDSVFAYLLKNKTRKADSFLVKSEKIRLKNDSLLKFRNTGFRGIIFYRKDDYKTSLKFLNEALRFFETLPAKYSERYSEALFYQFKGRTLSDIGLIASALNSYLKSNTYFESLGCKSKMYENFRFIGRAYQKKGLSEEKIKKFVKENYLKALNGFKEIKKEDETAWMYLVLSDYYIYLNDSKNALKYLDSCYVYAVKLQDKKLSAISLNNFGEIYLLGNKYDEAYHEFIRAVKEYKLTGNKKNLQITYFNLAKLFFGKKQYQKAESFIDSAETLAKANNNKANQLKFCLLKKNIYEKENKSVAKLFDFYVLLNKELEKERQNNLIFAYREYYQSDKLKKKNEKLIKANEKQTDRLKLIIMISVIVGFIITVIWISALYFRKKREKQLKDKLQSLHMQSVQAQLYPHLLFNTITAAGSVIYKEEKEKAYDFLVKMSQLIRKALEDSKRLYKTLEQEINFVSNYLEVQQLRFPERFKYDISIDNSVDLSIKVPQMIIQTYVENAVKYGLEALKKDGFLKVEITRKENTIRIIVEDNGAGIEASRKNARKGTGSGLKIMNEIYEIHNKTNKNRITFTLTDLYSRGKKGTRALVEIHLNP